MGKKEHRTVELPLVMDTFASNKACSSDSEHVAISTFSTPWSARSLKVKKTAYFLYI